MLPRLGNVILRAIHNIKCSLYLLLDSDQESGECLALIYTNKGLTGNSWINTESWLKIIL